MLSREYLSFWESISQVYFNHYTLVLVILIIKIYIFKTSIISSLQDIQHELNCSEINTSMLKSLIVDSINSIQLSNLKLFQMMILVVQNLIWFLIELFLGTYTCLLQAFIIGTADFAIDTSEAIIVGVNSTIVGLANDIEDGLNGLSTIINGLISAASSIANFFKGGTSNNNGEQYQNSINLSIAGLRNISIPGSVLTEMNNFKTTQLPNFTNLETDTKKLISEPLTSLANLFNTSNSNLINVNSSNFPQFPTQICNNVSAAYIKDLTFLSEKVELTARWIFVLLSVCCVVSILPLMLKHYRHYYIHNPNLFESLNGCVSGNYRDDIIMTNNVLNRYNNFFLNYLGYPIFKIKSHKIKWLISYLSTKYCMIIFGLGCLGLLSVLLQFIIIKVLTNHISSSNTFKEVLTQTNSTTNSLEVTNFINQINTFIQDEEDQINQQLFGQILNTTSSINSTISTFISGLNNTIVDVFSAVPVIESTISTVVYCTLVRKLVRIEQGLTWMNNNLRINIPSIGSNLQQDLVSQLSNNSPLSQDLNTLINRILNVYKKSIKLEFFISIIFLSTFVLQILIGLCILSIQTWLNKYNRSQDDYNNKQGTDPPHYDLTHISSPKPLSLAQKHEYGYPFTNPYEDKVNDKLTASSRYPSSLESI
ncbi:uncharacterized protein RJT21DRAFT_133000 [Scheffersomyces amazonensis]|uniref:uncharacterized protein n=1 Tax=Scheffersomyces amazonensis TaxID=1078765 RepID=UPI00315D9926